jgi:hypothetical protein
MVEEGSVVSRLAAELGVAAGTLERWLDGESGESGAERVRGFRRVDVVEAPRLGLILVTPSGYRVEGLELDQLQTLLPSLG